MSLIANVSIQSVADLYAQYARLAKSYSQSDNPLTGLTSIIPQRAQYFAVVPQEDSTLAFALMNLVRGRRKLRHVIAEASEIRYGVFSRVGKVVVLFA